MKGRWSLKCFITPSVPFTERWTINMKKQIAFFMSSMGRGGAERVISILSKEYCADEWDVTICLLLHNITDGYELDKRVNIIDMSYDTISNAVVRYICMLKSIRRFIDIRKPNVIVPFLAKTSMLVNLALLGYTRKGLKVVASERIDPYAAKYSPILRALVNRSFENADNIVFQTKRARSYYSKKIQEKSVIIGNPVSVNVERQYESNKVIINAGRLENQKNQKMLIEAFSKVSKKNDDYQLHVYGEGSLRKKLEKLISEKKLEDRIKLMGSQSNYQTQLSKCDFFVLSSDYEGLSNALLEAMMLAIPCISTNCAGSDEIINDRINGLLVPVGDIEMLSKAMETIIKNKDLAEKISIEAKKTSCQFETSKVISAWRKVLDC